MKSINVLSGLIVVVILSAYSNTSTPNVGGQQDSVAYWKKTALEYELRAHSQAQAARKAQMIAEKQRVDCETMAIATKKHIDDLNKQLEECKKAKH